MKIFLAIGGDEMIMRIWDFKSCKHRAYPLASGDFLQWFREFLGSLEYRSVIWFWNIGKVIYFYLWYNKGMSSLLGKYIKEGIHILILIEFVGWDFLGDDARKNTWHIILYRRGFLDEFICGLHRMHESNGTSFSKKDADIISCSLDKWVTCEHLKFIIQLSCKHDSHESKILQ
jgi:hypothetical protein